MARTNFNLRSHTSQLKSLLLLLLTYSFVFVSCTEDDPSTTIKPTVKENASIIDLSKEHQLIRGFGGATVFRLNFPLSNEDCDKIFGTEDGNLGFSMHRIRVATDNNSRAIELEHAKKALARGAQVIASPWSPPQEMKSNNDLVGGSLLPEFYDDYANYLNDFAKYMADNDAPLYAISIQNEPDIQVDYESCDWTAFEVRDFLKEHGDKIQNTQVIAAESFNFNQSLTNPSLNDDVAASNVDIIGGHIYGSGLADYFTARAKGKEVWMTEHLELDTTWTGVFDTGIELHNCMATANYNAYFWWYVKRYYGPLGEDGELTKRGYIMSQFSRFIRPGFHRVEATEKPQTGVLVSAYAGENETIIVAINDNSEDISQQFQVQELKEHVCKSYTTTESMNQSKGSDITLNEIGTFQFVMKAKSISTFVIAH